MSDSDSSVELIYDGGAPSSRSSSTVPSTGATKATSDTSLSSGSISHSSDVQCLSPTPMTHYRCIKFDPQSEVELVVRKWFNRPRGGNGAGQQPAPEQSAEEQDLAETLANLCKANTSKAAPLGTVFFTLVSGRVESFGIPIVTRRLYSINFGHRFVLQTFSGFEMCFLIQNPEKGFDILAKYIEPSTYRPRNLPPGAPTPHHYTTNEMQFVPLKSPFSSYNPKTQSLDTQLLSTLVQLDSRVSPTGEGKRRNSNEPERWRLGITSKCYASRRPGQQKTSSWLYQSYVQLAQELNRQRKEAVDANRAGPNVIIVGPCDSGKSTLAKIIVNYAINEQWSPMYVDLDVGQGAIGVPGMIGAGIIDQHCQLDQDYSFRLGHPMMVHFGGITPDNDKDVHELSVNCLARQIMYSLRIEEEVDKPAPPNAKLPANLNQATLVEHSASSVAPPPNNAWKRSQEDRSPMQTNQTKVPKRTLTKWSGLVINTHGWIFDYGYDSTMQAIRKFAVSTVLVLGDYRLYERIHRDLHGILPGRGNQPNHRTVSGTTNWNVTPNSGQLKVHFFQRNFSAVKRHSKLRRRLRMDRFARYFLGHAPALATVSIPFDNHPIFRFYSWENFSRFLSEQEQEQNQDRNGNWPPMNRSQVSPGNYWTCKVEKTGKDRRGGNYDQVVFYHLNREIMVYLMNRVLSVMAISMDQLLSHNQTCFSLRQLLQVRGYARVVQIDLETGSLQVELPAELASMLRDGELALLEIETVGPRRSKPAHK